MPNRPVVRDPVALAFWSTLAVRNCGCSGRTAASCAGAPTRVSCHLLWDALARTRSTIPGELLSATTERVWWGSPSSGPGFPLSSAEALISFLASSRVIAVRVTGFGSRYGFSAPSACGSVFGECSDGTLSSTLPWTAGTSTFPPMMSPRPLGPRAKKEVPRMPKVTRPRSRLRGRQ
ncbi:hypothetical protein ACFV2X_19795 [Streptomyces sp. NPDC059679]|uniref:hypothetical protein n=1 Tax=Streptomyces sp. NPDC059679 TaxID=3346903 RepID=UPI0036A3D881